MSNQLGQRQIKIIQSEVFLVNQKNKNPKHLQHLLYEAQLSPNIPVQYMQQKFIKLCLESSIASGNFRQFSNCLNRNKKSLGNDDLVILQSISQCQYASNFQKLIDQVIKLTKLKGLNLKQQILIDGARNYVLSQLSKNYINYELQKLRQYFGITSEWLLNNNFIIKGEYIYFDKPQKDQNMQRTLENRIKEVSQLTKNIIKLGK